MGSILLQNMAYISNTFLNKFANFSELVYLGAVVAFTVFFIAVSFDILWVLFSSTNVTQHNSIGDYEYISIPKPVSNYYDLLYIKLGYQTCINVLSPNTRTLYSVTWGWATLNMVDKIRISIAAGRAQTTGELQAIGHDRLSSAGSPIIILNTTRRAAARFDLVRIIRNNDI